MVKVSAIGISWSGLELVLKRLLGEGYRLKSSPCQTPNKDNYIHLVFNQSTHE